MTEEEIWIDVKGYENEYLVSNLGRVKSLDRHLTHKNGHLYFHRGRILSQGEHSGGYLQIGLGRKKNVYVHRLVAQHFLDSVDGKNEVNHKDGNKKNNHYSNLEWVTPSENQNHSVEIGLREVGEKHSTSKLTNEQVIYIREVYKAFHPEFGAKPLGEKFGVAKSIVCRIANGTRRAHG
jgi:hypothetical protein